MSDCDYIIVIIIMIIFYSIQSIIQIEIQTFQINASVMFGSESDTETGC